MKTQEKERIKRRPCSVIDCINTPILAAKKELSFFRFPIDNERSKKWVIACNRMDLYDKDPLFLHKNYRVCEEHFEYNMFSNVKKNRLNNFAYPVLFPDDNGKVHKRVLETTEKETAVPLAEEQFNKTTVYPIIISKIIKPKIISPVCRLCLEVTSTDCSTNLKLDNSQGNGKILEIYNYIDACIPSLDIRLLPNPIICDECYNNLLLCYNFQQTAIKNELRIKSHLSVNNLSCVDLDLNDLATSKINIINEPFVGNLDNYQDSPDYIVTINTTNLPGIGMTKQNNITSTVPVKPSEKPKETNTGLISHNNNKVKIPKILKHKTINSKGVRKVHLKKKLPTMPTSFFTNSISQFIISNSNLLETSNVVYDNLPKENVLKEKLPEKFVSCLDEECPDLEFDESELGNLHTELDIDEVHQNDI